MGCMGSREEDKEVLIVRKADSRFPAASFPAVTATTASGTGTATATGTGAKTGIAENCKAKAVRDYHAKNKSELSLIIGQILDIIDKTQKDWWMGQIEGQTAFGWFPSVNVQVIDEKEAIFEMEKRRLENEKKRRTELNKRLSAPKASKSMTVNSEGKVVKARAIRNYDGHAGDGPSEDKLPLEAGQVVVVTDKSHSGWWLGVVEGNNNMRGWFPVDAVEIIAEN